ncbi:tetratricopeptide repeat protein [Lujinxingia vulgaris]|uniref:Tetratricopeptide repeat protein n=1 Tax=Lujinxingia vulgaris TaxID=2600176 RepID=A0A5C6XET7_9DELT|nr:tetratricopeptide repeat protein [Lujinxingia vulgaris]TXD37875.1 tetratricopeptide repeat protein [Lujinxingia vulgaris]
MPTRFMLTRPRRPSPSRPGSRWPVALLSAALLSATLGCATPATPEPTWSDAFLAAMRLPDTQAEPEVAALAERAPNREQARDARFELARFALRRGDVALAEERFEALWAEGIEDHITSRALYESARIELEHHQRRAEAIALLHRAIAQTAPWAGTELALDFLKKIERQAGNQQTLIDDLSRIAAELENARLKAQLHLTIGELHHADLQDDEGALKAYRRAAKSCEDCSAADEAIWRMAEIYSAYQNFDAATRTLSVVAERTDTSWFVGSYNSHRAADARFELGRIHMLFLEDYEQARDHFERFIDTFPHAMRRDQAEWHLVEITRLTESERAYRRALRRFSDDFPESRLADEAHRRLEQRS